MVSDPVIEEYLDIFRDVIQMDEETLEQWRIRLTADPRSTPVRLGRRYSERRDPDDNIMLATADVGKATYHHLPQSLTVRLKRYAVLALVVLGLAPSSPSPISPYPFIALAQTPGMNPAGNAAEPRVVEFSLPRPKENSDAKVTRTGRGRNPFEVKPTSPTSTGQRMPLDGVPRPDWDPDKDESYQHVKLIQAIHEPELFKIPGVYGVGIGKDESGKWVIGVEVDPENPNNDLPMIPKSLDSIPVRARCGGSVPQRGICE